MAYPARNILVFVALWFANPSQADEAHDCTVITDDASRLACYDRALGRTTPSAKPKAAAAEFGMNPALKQKETPPQAVPDLLTMHVTSVQKNADGTFNLMMDNQQAWRTLESNWSIDFAPDDEIVIKRGLSGAYYLRKGSNNHSLRARRVE